MNDPDVLGIRIPSILIPEEFNYLINPNSIHIFKVNILEAKDFVFDVRVKGLLNQLDKVKNQCESEWIEMV